MTLKSTKAVILAMAAMLASCAPVDLLNTFTPSGSYSLMKDASYGDLERQALDVYKPDEPNLNAPILVYVHGGGWNEGSKNIYKFLAEGFTSEGYTVVVPNYRLFPDAGFPDMIVDTAKAVTWAAEQFPDRPLVLMGHSAGAYNVLMTVLDPSYMEAAGGDVCNRVAGVVSLAAPTGIIPLDSEPYITIFPDRLSGDDAPLNHTDTPVPPLLLINGADDKSVYPQNSEALGEKITARGGKATVGIYPDIDHIDIIRVLSRFFDGDSSIKPDILNFMEKAVQADAPYCH